MPALGEQAVCLPGRLLRHRAAKLQGLISLLAPAAGEHDDSAQERHDRDLF